MNRAWRALSSSRAAATACSAAAAASAAGTFSNPEARSSDRSSAGNGVPPAGALPHQQDPHPSGTQHVRRQAAVGGGVVVHERGERHGQPGDGTVRRGEHDLVRSRSGPGQTPVPVGEPVHPADQPLRTDVDPSTACHFLPRHPPMLP